MLTCQQMTELVTDYSERRLPLGPRLMFRLHLAMCQGCRAYVAQIRLTTKLVQAARRPQPAPEAVARLHEQYVAWAARSPRPKSE